jgi:malonyl-CoA O-methyltransferase
MTESTPNINEPLALRKSAVKAAFNRAATHYDDAAALQREVCDRTIEKLDLIKIDPQHIVDIGCGTGYGTYKLMQRFTKAQLTGVDVAQGMVDATIARCNGTGLGATMKQLFAKPRVTGVCADAEQLPMEPLSCDFVFSTFAIHWCDTLQAIKEAYRIAKPGALILIAVPGPDTLKELNTAFKQADPKGFAHINRFIDMHDVGDMLVEAGFADPVIDMEHIVVTHETTRDVMIDLKTIGASNHLQGRQQGLMGKDKFKRVIAAYEQFRDATTGKLPATYEVVYAHAWKPLQPKRIADGRAVVRLESMGLRRRGQS